jgi:hypothetical protein
MMVRPALVKCTDLFVEADFSNQAMAHRPV